ncbi:unnamed protein product [Linum trigynum]|uniref:Uncharacterized protein n=1 Tax=Linum trigynum TaxID=586398 RepID=A0AAV2DXX1_9ROSI
MLLSRQLREGKAAACCNIGDASKLHASRLSTKGRQSCFLLRRKLRRRSIYGEKWIGWEKVIRRRQLGTADDCSGQGGR